MSETNGKVLPAQVVTVIFKPEDPTARFQALPSSLADSNASPIFTSFNQGEMISWLVLNGYEWVSYTNESFPQQWVKS